MGGFFSLWASQCMSLGHKLLSGARIRSVPFGNAPWCLLRISCPKDETSGRQHRNSCDFSVRPKLLCFINNRKCQVALPLLQFCARYLWAPFFERTLERYPCVRSNPLQESGCRVSKTGGFLQFWCARICAYNSFCLIRPSPDPVPR